MNAGLLRRILPEGATREIIARNLGISAQNDYAMLERIGGECAGAVTFIPAGQTRPERNYSYRKLSAGTRSDPQGTPKRPLLAGEEEYVFRSPGRRTKSPYALRTAKSAFPWAARRARIFSSPRQSVSRVLFLMKSCA